MPEENVDIVRGCYEAVNRGDLAGAEAYLHPEIEFHTYAQSPEAGVYRGKKAVRKYNETLFGQFEVIRFEVDDLVDAGDRVIVVTTQHAVPKGGRQEMNVHVAEVWAIRDGLLAERRSYSTKAEALEAAGLRDVRGGPRGVSSD
jgi:ketosteroid isomerase-like protein